MNISFILARIGLTSASWLLHVVLFCRWGRAVLYLAFSFCKAV